MTSPRRFPAPPRQHASKTKDAPMLILAAPEAIGPGWHPQPVPAFLRASQRRHASKPATTTPAATDSVAQPHGLGAPLSATHAEGTPTPRKIRPSRALLESHPRTANSQNSEATHAR